MNWNVLFAFMVCCTSLLHSSDDRRLNQKGEGNTDTQAKLQQTFAVLDRKNGLFTANDEFVLKPGYESANELSEIQVVPKYFLNRIHPEWKEPSQPDIMPSVAYRALLRQIEAVKPLGSAVSQGNVGVTLNLRTSFLDQYEKGFVERAMFRNAPEEDYGVAWFTVWYFHVVSGTIESKDVGMVLGQIREYKIKINGRWYRTAAKAFGQLRVGQGAKFEAAGPIDVSK